MTPGLSTSPGARWLRNNVLLVVLAVLLVTASGTTISVAMRLGTASNLQVRTEQLNVRVHPDEPETTGDDAQKTPPPKKDDNEAARTLAQRIGARHLFTNPPSPQFRNVIGVLGNAALYPGGDILAVGEQREGATLKAVGPDWVEFEYEGESIHVNVLDGGGGGGGGPQMGGPSRSRPSGGGQQFGGPGGGPGGNFDRDAMRQRFQNMTPEEREAMRDRFRQQRGDGNGGNGGERRGRGDGNGGGERGNGNNN